MNNYPLQVNAIAEGSSILPEGMEPRHFVGDFAVRSKPTSAVEFGIESSHRDKVLMGVISYLRFVLGTIGIIITLAPHLWVPSARASQRLLCASNTTL